MVQILPEVPSFGTQLARGLGSGISSGISQSVQFAQQMALEKYKKKQRHELVDYIENQGKQPSQQRQQPFNQQSFDKEFIEALPNIEQALGRELIPEEIDKLYSHAQQLRGSGMQQPGQQMQEEDPFRKSKAYAVAGEHELARVETERAKTQEKRRIAEEEREFLPKKEYIQHAAKENIAFLDDISQIEKDLPTTEFSLAMVEDSLGNANKWSAFKDMLAEKSGFAGFRSASGAELDSGIKNYFLGDLTSIKGGRANQFLEKQIRDAYPKAGQDPISNQKIQIGMKMKEQINRLKVEKTRELESQFLDKQGYLPSGFKSLVNKSIKSEVEKIEKQAIDTLHNMTKIQEERDKIFRKYLNPGEVLMMDQKGDSFAVPKKEESFYREQGYIPLGKK